MQTDVRRHFGSLWNNRARSPQRASPGLSNGRRTIWSHEQSHLAWDEMEAAKRQNRLLVDNQALACIPSRFIGRQIKCKGFEACWGKDFHTSQECCPLNVDGGCPKYLAAIGNRLKGRQKNKPQRYFRINWGFLWDIILKSWPTKHLCFWLAPKL